MKKFAIPAMAILLAGLLTWTTGCKKDDNATTEFVIKIDSIVLPDTINRIDTLKVEFYGLVGNNGCYKFDRIEQVDAKEKSMRFKVWGKYEEQENCPNQIVYLDDVAVTIHGLFPGIFSVFVVQPDGSIMTSLVYVEE